jgi:signal transduction histidine kinase
VADLLRHVARRFATAAAQKGLSLRVEGDDDLEAFTDRQKLDRVVTNLVDNAIKFTERGGVTVWLGTSGPLAVVRVSDTGRGVDAQNAPYLFDEFYQGKGPAGGSGFGMGLAICRFLARQLGGDVRLAHTGPGGTSFEARIPHTPANHHEAPSRRAAEAWAT